MFHLIQKGKLAQLEELYAKDNSVFDCIRHPKSKETLLHSACACNQFEIVEFLLKNSKIDLEAVDFDQKTALHVAAQHEAYESVVLLLEFGCQVNVLKKAEWTPIMLACVKKCIKTVRKLIEFGADLALKNKDGWTCFHIAVREGHLPILEYLLEVNPLLWQTKSKNGRTPLHTAALNLNSRSTVSFLLDKGNYPVDEHDSCENTPFVDAIRSGHVEVASVLFERKANPHHEDKHQRQAIHFAAQAGQCESIKFLVNFCFVNVNAVSHFGTPLHFAAKEQQYLAVQLLLQLGADKTIADKLNRTAYDITCSLECLDLLKIKGVT